MIAQGRPREHIRYYNGSAKTAGETRNDFTHLCDFAQSSALFPEVNDHATASVLSLLHGLLDSIYKIWPAGTDVRAEDIASIALGHVSRVSKA